MKKIKFYRSLRFQLMMIVLFLMIIPMFIIGSLLSNTLKDIFSEKYSAVALQSIHETGDKIDYMLSDIEDYTTSLLASASFLDLLATGTLDDKVMDETLRGFLASKNDIDGISLINSTGTYAIGTNKATPMISIQLMMKNQSDGKPMWFSTKQQNIKILSGVFSRYYFSVVRNIIDFNTLENYGVLVVDVEESLLEQAYDNLTTDGADVFIIDEKGIIVSHPNKSRIGSTVTNSAYYDELIHKNDTSDKVFFQDNGESYAAFYSVLDTNGWRIIKTISSDVLFSEINQIQRYFILGGGLYGVLMMAFLLGFALQYTEPMLKVIQDIKRVEQGDLTVRTHVNTSNEISQLSNGINNMIDEMSLLIDRLVEEEKMKREVELEALHAQINPHFLYNTLNTIKWMAKIQGADSVSNAIVALVKLLRISINISGDFIPLKEEIEYIQNYVFIQKLRFNEDFLITYDVDETLSECMIPKLILQPIIENSIIYGVENAEKLEIKVICEKEQIVKTETDILIIKIIDNGPGIPQDILKTIFKDHKSESKFSKAGLNNVNQRIKLFCGDAFGQEILTKETFGTTVIVRLPIRKEGEIHV